MPWHTCVFVKREAVGALWSVALLWGTSWRGVCCGFWAVDPMSWCDWGCRPCASRCCSFSTRLAHLHWWGCWASLALFVEWADAYSGGLVVLWGTEVHSQICGALVVGWCGVVLLLGTWVGWWLWGFGPGPDYFLGPWGILEVIGGLGSFTITLPFQPSSHAQLPLNFYCTLDLEGFVVTDRETPLPTNSETTTYAWQSSFHVTGEGLCRMCYDPLQQYLKMWDMVGHCIISQGIRVYNHCRGLWSCRSVCGSGLPHPPSAPPNSFCCFPKNTYIYYEQNVVFYYYLLS